MNIDKEIFQENLTNHEQDKFHLDYQRETAFYLSIKLGDKKEALSLYRPLDSDGLGKLSNNRLRNLKYHLIITIAFITRYCIEGGMEAEAAYNMSDIYIRRLDDCTKEEEIHRLHRTLVEEYADRMAFILKGATRSKPIIQCIEHISSNLFTKITLTDLSGLVRLSPEYLSKLFHKEVGLPVTKYITLKKIEAAKKMLRYSDYSCSEISNYLCFSSESHFISVFKKESGATPKEYRERIFRSRS